MAREDGGIVLKLVGWLALIAVLASVALFAFVRTQEPLALGDVKVGGNDAAAAVSSHGPVRYRAGGEIYVATFVKNTGRLEITLQGLGTVTPSAHAPYVPTRLLLGSGTTANPKAAAAFTATSLARGSGVGVLIVFTTNPDLVCGELPAHPHEGRTVSLPGVPIRYTTYGIEQTQTVTSKELPRVAAPSRDACQAARAAGSG